MRERGQAGWGEREGGEGGRRGDGRRNQGQRSALLPLLQYTHPPTHTYFLSVKILFPRDEPVFLSGFPRDENSGPQSRGRCEAVAGPPPPRTPRPPVGALPSRRGAGEEEGGGRRKREEGGLRNGSPKRLRQDKSAPRGAQVASRRPRMPAGRPTMPSRGRPGGDKIVIHKLCVSFRPP